MDKILEDYMDWPGIEAVIYAEHDNPHDLLGVTNVREGFIVNAFFPNAEKVSLVLHKDGTEYQMQCMDEEGFFSILVKKSQKEKKLGDYTFLVVNKDHSKKVVVDPYSFEPVLDAMDMNRFESGIHYDIYEKLGAHPMEINKVKGMLFAVWAPNALAVSVVGDFNSWDGRVNLMRRLGDSGIFELFLPGLQTGELYKYEIKVKGGLPVLKSDPYGAYCEVRPANASITWNLEQYQWNDSNWMKERKEVHYEKSPMSIYEVHLGSWKKPLDEEKEFFNYREIAPMLVDYCKEMGYTHVELMPVMEHPLDESWGYQVTGYYAPTSRYGNPDDFMNFMDILHQNGIGVILDWVPAHFPKDTHGLACFDGTCLYEHLDPRQGTHPHWGTLIYNYKRPQVENFLVANALYWIEKFHADGLRMDAVASMLYLDYGKNDGEWIPNMYGGNENLDAVDLIQKINGIVAKRNKGVIMIAEESTSWPLVTGDIKKNGLGFDFKWNMGWMNDFTEYMKTDPLFRKGRHGALTFSMVYHYSEKFILVLSHDEVVHGKGSMIEKMPGEYQEKFANLRVAYGYMMAHPGKKLLFMGQDFAQFSEWNEKKSIEWELIEEYESHRNLHEYVKECNAFYVAHPALYELDYDTNGFEWISALDADHSIIAFLRKSKGETLLVICNFTPVTYEKFKVGVPYKGKYKEIFNSDRVEYGGDGHYNPRLKQSKPLEWDGRENSIQITVPPLGISVFQCTKSVSKSKSK